RWFSVPCIRMTLRIVYGLPLSYVFVRRELPSKWTTGRPLMALATYVGVPWADRSRPLPVASVQAVTLPPGVAAGGELAASNHSWSCSVTGMTGADNLRLP